MSFFPGAKIGVVGPNGAGKSSVLRIMAGLDKPNNGDAFLATGASVGILQQEPPLNEEKTVRGNVEEGLGEIKVKLDRFNEVAELMATDYSDELMEEMGRLQEQLDHADAWDLDSQLEQAMDALRCPPPDEPVTNLSGGERRRVALCKLLLSEPDLLLLDEPTNHLDAEKRGVARAAPGQLRRRGLAVTHDRYFLDNVAEWILELDRGRAYPYEGNYSTWLEQKQERLAVQGGKDAKSQKRAADELEWVRSGPGPAGEEQGAAAALRGDGRRGREDAQARCRGDPDPGRARGWASVVVEVDHLDKGYGDRLLIKDLSFTLPPQRHRRRHRPERGRQDHAVPMIVGAGGAGQRHASRSARPSSSAYVDQARDGHRLRRRPSGR